MSNLDDAEQRLHQAIRQGDEAEAQAERERQREESRRTELDKQAANLLSKARSALAPFRSRLIEAIRKPASHERGCFVSHDNVERRGVRLLVPEPSRSDGFSPQRAAELFNVCATSCVNLERTEGEGRTLMAASLWYCDAEQASDYRWYQIAFSTSASVRSRRQFEPFDLDPNDEDAPLSLLAMHSVAPKSFEAVNEDTFTDRWITLFASALEGGRLDDWPANRRIAWRQGNRG